MIRGYTAQGTGRSTHTRPGGVPGAGVPAHAAFVLFFFFIFFFFLLPGGGRQYSLYRASYLLA